MSNDRIGWLPYASTHESVMFFNPLTSLAEVNSIPGTVAKIGGPAEDTIFDSVKGMKVQDSLGYQITQTTDYADLNNGGQISFEIESNLLNFTSSDAGTTGSDTSLHPTNYCFFVLRELTGGANNLGLFFSTGTNKQLSIKDTNVIATDTDFFDRHASALTNRPRHHSLLRTKEFSTIQFAWWPSGTGYQTIIAVDGVIYGQTFTSNAFTGDIANRIYLGCYLASGSTAINDTFMRNFQISTLVPAFGFNSNVGSVLLWSDSLFVTSAIDDMSANVYGEANVIGAYRNSIGSMTGKVSVQSNSGYAVIETASTSFADTLSDAVAIGAKTVVFLGGINDVIQTPLTLVGTTFETDYKTNISGLFDGGADNILVCKIPTSKYNSAYDGAIYVENVQYINDFLDTLVAWAATNYPAKTLIVCDLHTATGGETGDKDNFRGGYTNLVDNLHWHALGTMNVGREIARVIKSRLYL